MALSKEVHNTGQNGKWAHHRVAYCKKLRNQGTCELEDGDRPGDRGRYRHGQRVWERRCEFTTRCKYRGTNDLVQMLCPEECADGRIAMSLTSSRELGREKAVDKGVTKRNNPFATARKKQQNRDETPRTAKGKKDINPGEK